VLEDGSDKGIEDIDDGTSVGRILDNTGVDNIGDGTSVDRMMGNVVIKLGYSEVEGNLEYLVGAKLDITYGSTDGTSVGSKLLCAFGDRVE